MLRPRALRLGLLAALLTEGVPTTPQVALAQPAASAPAAPPPSPLSFPHDHNAELEAAIRTLLAGHGLKDAQIGIAILDVDTGHFLATYNEHMPLNPASNAKLYTAGAALAHLHGDHRFETTLSGNAKNGAVTGPLVLRGHGDPSLSTEDLWGMVQELRAHGIRRVDGDILVDQRFFDEQTTPPAFEQQPNEWAAFRAPVSAVAVNENTITLTVRPASAPDSPATASFDPPGFVDSEGTINTAESGADTVVLALAGNGRRMSAKLAGAISQDSKVVRYSRRVEDPTLLAGYVLRNLLEKADIKVTGDVKTGSLRNVGVIVKHESEPLGRLLYALGKNSDNFYAEMIFKTLAGEVKGRPAKSESSAGIVLKWVESIGAADTGVVVKNGSGLFDANRVTTASLVQVLRACFRDSAIQPEFVAQLAVGGVDGTLHKRFRDTRGRRVVRAKTGTLEDAAALSGYVLGPPGKGPVAFSAIVNHATPSQGRAAIDTLVELLVVRQWGSK
jgi:D-alanyl-D-alanine carboxypeptidase/D-alanyl-D-alanine-endopeptidase (penicillin-binding protein 4)